MHYVRTLIKMYRDVCTEDRGKYSVCVSFSKQDARGVLDYENDAMVIKVYIRKYSVKQVLIDLGSSTDVLY